MKDVLLNRSSAFGLALRKFLYFAGACVLAAILAERGISDAYEGYLRPHPSVVALSTAWRMGWYLFLFLMPWEAYKSILALQVALSELKEEKSRADKFAHGFKSIPSPEMPEPSPGGVRFEIEQPDTERIPDARIDWRTDWKERVKQDFQGEPEEIGYKRRSRESVEAYCKRNGIRY